MPYPDDQVSLSQANSKNLPGLLTPPAAGGATTIVQSASAAAYMPHVSQYDRALIFAPPPRQMNAVKGFSRNINDAQYVGAITDAELYDTEVGALRVGQSTSKALAFPWSKMSWDLGAGESLLIQMRVKTVAATAAVQLFGNYNSADAGFSLAMYESSNATWPGFIIMNYKAQGAAAQAMQLQAAAIGGGAVTGLNLPTDTWVNLTLHVDGASRVPSLYTNGQPNLNMGGSNTKFNAGSTLQTAGSRRNFGIGHAPTDDSYTTTTAKAMGLQAFRMAVLPAGLRFLSPAFLDWRFNNNPRVLFNDTDYIGAQ